MHYRTTRHQVYSQIQHISADREFLSLTVYNSTSWRQNVADFFDIQYVNIQDLGVGFLVVFFFTVIGLVYTVVCVSGVFLKLPARRRTSTRWDSVYCIVTYLPWYFRLTLWLSHDSAIVTSLQIPADINWPVCPLTALLCSFPHCLFPKVLHGVNMAFRTLAICILSLQPLLYSLPLACHLVDYVSWFFFSTWTIDISYLLDVNLD